MVEEGYVNDAYNSLSIKGYRVTPELIEKSQPGELNPDQNITDIQQKDAMAAKGYQMAFQVVKRSISNILEGENPGDVVARDHPLWYIELFSPMIQAGIIKLMKEEESASVRAILGHFVFVYIHPYSDGNGRIGRFIMNCMLASGGFDWCVVPVNQRNRYMLAFEAACYGGDITKFITFIRDVYGISSDS